MKKFLSPQSIKMKNIKNKIKKYKSQIKSLNPQNKEDLEKLQEIQLELRALRENVVNITTLMIEELSNANEVLNEQI